MRKTHCRILSSSSLLLLLLLLWFLWLPKITDEIATVALWTSATADEITIRYYSTCTHVNTHTLLMRRQQTDHRGYFRALTVFERRFAIDRRRHFSGRRRIRGADRIAGCAARGSVGAQSSIALAESSESVSTDVDGDANSLNSA